MSFSLFSQDGELPYRQIPDYAEDYRSGNVVARFIDGLGFRYYWATEGLTEKDLAYKPSKKARTTLETLQHICNLSQTIVDASQQKPTNMPLDFSALSFEELRAKTLTNIEAASKAMLGKKNKHLKKHKIIFKRNDKQSEYPYWNMMNGPIADAIYHTGQVVSFRRASGNPINPNISVLQGKLRE